LLVDHFTEATTAADTVGNHHIQSAITWYALNSHPGGAPPGVISVADAPPLDGKVLHFIGGSSNSLIVGAIPPVTLARPGDCVQVKVDYRYRVAPQNPGATFIGLFDDNGSPVAQNELGSQTQITGDKGYKIVKTQAGADLGVYAVTIGGSPASPFFSGGTSLAPATDTTIVPKESTTAVYTLTLKLTLAPNGDDLQVDGSFAQAGGGTFAIGQVTIPAAQVLTRTFNQVVISPSTGGAGGIDVDNVEVTGGGAHQ
jgi:hypothetical protein